MTVTVTSPVSTVTVTTVVSTVTVTTPPVDLYQPTYLDAY